MKKFLIQKYLIKNYLIHKIDQPTVLSSDEIQSLIKLNFLINDIDFKKQFPTSLFCLSEPIDLSLKKIEGWIDREKDGTGLILWKSLKS